MASGTQAIGRLVISIDVPGETSRLAADAHPARELADWAISTRTVVTWGFDQPDCPFAAWLVKADPQQELALLAPQGTDRRPIVRGDLSRRLERQFNSAKSLGRRPTAVLFTGIGRPEQLDLFSQVGLSAARGTRAQRQPDGVWPRARSLRHGVWEIPPSAWIDGRQSFFTRLTNTRRTRLMAVRAAEEGGAVHFAVHTGGVTTAPAHALLTLSDVVRATQKQREEGRLYSVSLTAAAEALAPKLQPRSSRSILREAA